MNLGIITNIASPYQVDLFQGISSLGPAVSVLFLSESEPNRDWPVLEDAAFDFRYLSPQIDTPAGYLNPRIATAMREASCDVWVLGGSYSYPSTWLARRFAMRQDVPWIFWGERPASLRISKFKHHYLKRFFRSASGIWGVSERASALYSELAPSGVPCHTIPYSVPAIPSRASRDAVDRAGSEVRLILVGQLIDRKNPAVAIKTVSLLNQAGVAATLEIVGSGPLDGSLRRLASATGGAVVFRGSLPRDQALARLAEADVMLFPTSNDGWGLVVMESLSVGTPVVGSHQSDALLEANARAPRIARCTDIDPESISAEVVQLVEEGNLRNSEASSLAKVVAAEFATPAVARRVLAAL